MGGIDDIGARIVASVKQYVGDATASTNKRLDEIESRMKDLDSPHRQQHNNSLDALANKAFVDSAIEEMADQFCKGLMETIDVDTIDVTTIDSTSRKRFK